MTKLIAYTTASPVWNICVETQTERVSENIYNVKCGTWNEVCVVSHLAYSIIACGHDKIDRLGILLGSLSATNLFTLLPVPHPPCPDPAHMAVAITVAMTAATGPVRTSRILD